MKERNKKEIEYTFKELIEKLGLKGEIELIVTNYWTETVRITIKEE